MTLDKAKQCIGRMVVYKPYPNCDSKLNEVGQIVSTNSKFVFVRYKGDINSKATRAEDLTLEIPLKSSR